MIILHIANVLRITQPAPFSYTGKKGLVTGFECFVTGETVASPDLELDSEPTGLAKVQFRAATVEALAEKVKKAKLTKGEPAQIKLRLFDVGQNDMYNVNAA